MFGEKSKTFFLTLLLFVIGANAFAQEVVDSVWVDTVEVYTVTIDSEMFTKELAYGESDDVKVSMDSCIQARYTIISENGKYGIYDTKKESQVTAIDMDYIQYSHYSRPEENMSFCYFYYEKGLQYGKIGINMNDNTKINMAIDNPRLVGKADDYPSIDPLITAKSRDVLGKCMVDIDGFQGQVAVVDAKTSQVLSWSALENGECGIVNMPLLKKFCSSEVYMPLIAADCLAQSGISLEDSIDTGDGILELGDSMIIRDHNWRRGGYGMLTYRQALLNKSRIGMYRAMMAMPNGMDCWTLVTDKTKNTNAMEIAATFNSLYHADSINIDAESRRNIREISIGLFKEGGIQHRRAPKNVELAGVYLVTGDDTEQALCFVGCFPSDNPRYAISMVILREQNQSASSVMLSNAVNTLIEWLNNKTE